MISQYLFETKWVSYSVRTAMFGAFRKKDKLDVHEDSMEHCVRKTSNSNANQNELTSVFSDQLRHGWRNWGWILSYATAWLSSMLSRELRTPNDITIDCDAVLQRQQGQLSINMAARSRQIVTDQLIDSSRLLADLRHTPDSWLYLYLCRYCAQISPMFQSGQCA